LAFIDFFEVVLDVSQQVAAVGSGKHPIEKNLSKIQEIIGKCLDDFALSDELFLQLIKLATGHPAVGR
jgi:hypothetical protein